jgi:hypothetical protein
MKGRLEPMGGGTNGISSLSDIPALHLKPLNLLNEAQPD